LALDEAALHSIPSIIQTWSPKGIQPQVLADNKKRQRVTLFGTVNLKNGRITSAVAERGNIKTFRVFLRQILRKYPKKKIHILLDNVRFHHANKIKKEYLPKVKRFHFHYLPSYSPDFNPQEWVWKQMRREATHNTYFENFEDEQKQAIKFLRRYKLPVNKLLCRIIY